MKKKFLILLLMLPAFGMYCENQIESSFLELEILKTAKLNHQQSIFLADNCIRYFVPKGNFSSSGVFSLTEADTVKGYNENCSISFTQLFPGYTTLNWNISGDINGIINGSEEENPLNYYVTPEITLNIPLIFAKGGIGCLDDYGRRYAFVSRRMANLNYQISLCSAKKTYIDGIGNFLYLKELQELNQIQLELLKKRLEDSEELFRLGEISYLKLAEENTEYSNLMKNQLELNANLLEAKNLLNGLGIAVEECNFSLEEFVQVWARHFEIQNNEAEWGIYSEEHELLSAQLSSYSQIDDLIGYIPYVSASANMKSKEVTEGFPDFSRGVWQFSLNVNVPFQCGAKYSCGKQLSNLKKITELEKVRIRRSYYNDRKRKYAALELYDSYCNALKDKLELEKGRVEIMKELVAIGTVPLWDLLYQENFSKIQALELSNGELQRVSVLAGFY